MTGALAMSVPPQVAEYLTAMDDPSTCLLDEELKGLTPERGRYDLPMVYSGDFAVTFRLRGHHGPDVAVRCFLKPDDYRAERYAAIEQFLRDVDHPCWTRASYIEQGMYLPDRGVPLPIVRMDWVEGLTLEKWLAEHGSDRPRLERVRSRFTELVEGLAEWGVAHGDLQHGNVIVTADDSLRLVDYDGMYLPELKALGASETGHANYQHPERNLALRRVLTASRRF